MQPLVSTKDPAAVRQEIQSVYQHLFPRGDVAFVGRAFGWAKDSFTGLHPGYEPVDAAYHDFEHTLQGALCMMELLRGRQEAGAPPLIAERPFQLGLLAILLHDTGYLKKRGDTAGTGAKYTITHVERSAAFAAEFLGAKGCLPAEILAVQNMIHCTGVDAELHKIHFQNEIERVLGHALGTADLLGQMAAADYVEKLPVLYAEFAEAARFSKDPTHFVSMYSSADQLLRMTPGFWDGYVLPKLERDFGGLYRFLNDPYPDGPNSYLARIEANMLRLRQRLTAPD